MRFWRNIPTSMSHCAGISFPGHSLGGMRCQQYSLCYPDEVDVVIAVDAVMMPMESLQVGGHQDESNRHSLIFCHSLFLCLLVHIQTPQKQSVFGIRQATGQVSWRGYGGKRRRQRALVGRACRPLDVSRPRSD